MHENDDKNLNKKIEEKMTPSKKSKMKEKNEN